jgi:hypothetical protein
MAGHSAAPAAAGREDERVRPSAPPPGARTNLPTWPEEAPGVDATGTAQAVIAVGAAARAVADRWCAQAAATGAPVWRHDAGTAADAARALAGQLASARVGWRLLLAGPEADVLALRALALDAGAVDAEVRCHATSTTEKVVRCAHCSAHTRAEVPLGGLVTCPGCGRALTVQRHLSRRHGAHLGVRA